MIDTIIVSFNKSEYWEIDRYNSDLNKVINYLSSAGEEVKYFPNGSWKINSKGIELHGYQYHFTLTVSLWKFFKGVSGKPFEIFEVQPAIKLLSRKLGIAVEKGILARIDIALNIQVEHEVTKYLNEITRPNRFEYLFDHHGESVGFRNKSKTQQIVFYDKVEQMDAKEKILREDWPDNILRYEYRIVKQLQQVINLNNNSGRDKVRVIHLYSSVFLNNLIERWFKSFWKINWIGLPTTESIVGMKDFRDYLAGRCILDNGGVSTWCKVIDGFRNVDGKPWSASVKSKARSYLKEITSNENLVKPSIYGTEIKKKVIDCFLGIKRHQKSGIFVAE